MISTSWKINNKQLSRPSDIVLCLYILFFLYFYYILPLKYREIGKLRSLPVEKVVRIANALPLR